MEFAVQVQIRGSLRTYKFCDAVSCDLVTEAQLSALTCTGPLFVFCRNFFHGLGVTEAPAHSLRNVPGLSDVSRVPTRSGNDSLPLGEWGDVIAGRVLGWLRLY